MMSAGIVSVLVLVGAGVPILMATVTVFTAVTRVRLERFALRQALVITVDNGADVIRYLATTRRWRGSLLTVSLSGSILYDLVAHDRFTITGLGAFSGWFIGAVIAEWRVDTIARGPSASASLHRRRLVDYVPAPVLVVLALAWGAVALLTVAAVVRSVTGRSSVTAAVGVMIAVVVLAAIVWTVSRRVLTRAQPLAAPDVLDADNAMRGRSLNVLAGSGLAIGGLLTGVAAGQVWRDIEPGLLSLISLFCYLVLPLMAVVTAMRPRLVPIKPYAVPRPA